MSKTGNINWIDSSKKPRTFSEMREAFSQIRGMMSDWRKKQETFDNTPDGDLATRVANLSALVENMKASAAMCRSPVQDEMEMAYLLDAIHKYMAVPAGTVVYVCSHKAPYGYLNADGSAVSREDYKELFSAIGVRFGSGDGVSTFNLPDLRGEFIRGLDNGRGIDAGRELGNVQMDEFKSHYHGFLDRPNMRLESGVYTWTPQVMEVAEQDSISTTRAGGSETRPRNIALLACVKY